MGNKQSVKTSPKQTYLLQNLKFGNILFTYSGGKISYPAPPITQNIETIIKNRVTVLKTIQKIIKSQEETLDETVDENKLSLLKYIESQEETVDETVDENKLSCNVVIRGDFNCSLRGDCIINYLELMLFMLNYIRDGFPEQHLLKIYMISKKTPNHQFTLAVSYNDLKAITTHINYLNSSGSISDGTYGYLFSVTLVHEIPNSRNPLMFESTIEPIASIIKFIKTNNLDLYNLQNPPSYETLSPSQLQKQFASQSKSLKS